MSRCTFCECKGEKILQVNFDNCQTEEFEKILAESTQIMTKQPLLSVLVIGIVGEGTPIATDKDRIIRYFVSNIPHVKGAALVGLSGVKGEIIKGVINQVYNGMGFFKTLDEAKDWLAAID